MSVSNPTTADRLRWIVNTSIEEGKAEIKRSQNDPDFSPSYLLSLFQSALEAERSGNNRASLVTALSLAVIKAQKASCLPSSVSKSSVCDVVAPSWDRARQILSGITLALRISLAGQVMLGAELQQLKRELGFAGSGRRPQGSQQKTWAQHVKDELNLSADTADRMIASWEAAKAKLKKLGGQPALLAILDTPPSSLTAIQRQTLEAAVAKTTDGETQKSLLEELKLVKLHDTSGIGGDTSAHRGKTDPATVGQLAFKFFTAVAEPLRAVCTINQREAYFHAMAEEFPAELSTFEQMLETALSEVRAAKARRVNPKS